MNASHATSTTSEAVTYCRICPAVCGLVLTVTDNRVTAAHGDPQHPLSSGYTCAKGRHVGAFHSHPDRYLSSQRRGPDGQLHSVPFASAVSEIAEQLSFIGAQHGPDAIAMFLGTQAVFATLTRPAALAWFRQLGSHKLFSTMTIDQSAKWVRPQRLGEWAGGRQRFDEADVWLLVGSNPLVSMQGGDFTGFPVQNVSRSLAAARRRGLSLIVIDPRRSETAARADIHLQPRPGTDAVLIAGLLRVILSENRHDTDFTRRYAEGVDALRAAVEPLTTPIVAARTGVPEASIIQAARVFARGPRGMAMSGTGPDMGPDANLTEHLLGVLNAICGRFPREGERSSRDGVLVPSGDPHAGVIAPRRRWTTGFHSRIGGYGTLFGELPSSILPAEILEPGMDKVRALIVVGGNPAAIFPDQHQTVQALRSLELLVTIDPFPTETALLADYVIAPTMALERADHTGFFDGTLNAPFAQYTPAILDRPGEVVEDWEFFAALASQMDLPIKLAGRTLKPEDDRPTPTQYLAWTAERGRVSLDDVMPHQHGRRFDDLPPLLVGPDPGTGARFDLAPADVCKELNTAISRSDERDDRPYRLVVRRARHTMNTLGRQIPGVWSRTLSIRASCTQRISHR